MTEVSAWLASRRELIDRTLDQHLPAASTEPRQIHEAMRYAVLGGGKRIRPLLAVAAAEAIGGKIDPLLRAFSALELIHTYSLVHDDLPSIDNDVLRRGRKTVHLVFGEAIAVLTGDALLTEAFAWLSAPVQGVDPAVQMGAMARLTEAVNSRGMIGGQVADIIAERMHHGESSRDQLVEAVRFIHQNKTGKLITASVVLGGLLAGGDSKQIGHLEEYGRSIGLTFQIVDDLLDQEESPKTLGKTAGKDLAQGKLTYPAVIGAEAARAEASQLLDRAIESAGKIPGPVNYLGALARYICARRN